MPVINGVYLKDFTALPSSVTDANIIPIAISGNQIAYRTTVGGIVTDARVTSKLLTGLSVTGGAVVATDTILQAFGKVQNQINSKVSSVGLTMPSAFNVANSPITSAGTLAVTAAGVASQYIRGDGALADFPTTGGGGSSVAYYLNGSVNQGTFVGNTYYEMNKTPVIGTGTDFTINANGYIAQFITDANDPASLLIPGGNWNVEMYFSASSSGGTPSFYVEVYKYNGTTFTLLGSSATTPEGITNGTAIDIYYTSVGIPETVLAITDRLAIRVYVTHSGRTITLHTEDNHLSEIVTTFSNGLTALNGLTKQAQYFAVGSTGTDFNISSSVDTHTFNIPSASASNRGLITTGTQTIAGAKTFSGNSVFQNNDSSNPAVKFRNQNGSGITAEWLTSTNTVGGTIYNNGLISTTPQGDLYGSAINSFTSSQLAASLTDETGTGSAVFSVSPTFTGVPVFGATISNGTYTYTLPSSTGTLALTSALSNYVDLSTNQTIAGIKTFSSQIIADGTVSIWKGTTSGSSSNQNSVGIGTSTLGSNTTGSTNTAIGASALQSNTTGLGNTAVGHASLLFNLSGQHNTSIGLLSSYNTTGGTNTSVGAFSLQTNTSGAGNTAIGYYAQQAGTGAINNNTAIGNYSLSQNLANSNTGVGAYAGLANTTGTNNTFVGFSAGGVTTGSGNTILGASVVLPSTSANNIAIGNGTGAIKAQHDGTNWTLTGGTTITGVLTLNSTITNGTYTYTLPSATGTLALTSALSGYLPLIGGTLTGALSGTTATFSASTNALNIGNSQNSAIALSTFGKTSTSGYATANNYLQIGAGENATSSTRLIGFGYSVTANTNQPAYIGYIETSNTGETKGSLIFGTRDVTTDTAPTTRLTIASTGAATFSNLAGAGSRAVNADASGTLSAASDSRLKQEVLDYKVEGLAEILKMQPRAYKWLSDIENRGENAATEIGFFANEVASIIPSAAPMGNDGYYGFYDRAVIAALVNSVQEQQTQIEELKLLISK